MRTGSTDCLFLPSDDRQRFRLRLRLMRNGVSASANGRSWAEGTRSSLSAAMPPELSSYSCRFPICPAWSVLPRLIDVAGALYPVAVAHAGRDHDDLSGRTGDGSTRVSFLSVGASLKIVCTLMRLHDYVTRLSS